LTLLSIINQLLVRAKWVSRKFTVNCSLVHA
jgi:hypothetical protein